MRLILIFGYMHSGTSILHRTIRSAGNIYAPKKEINFFNYKLARYRNNFSDSISRVNYDTVVTSLAEDISGNKNHTIKSLKLENTNIVDLFFNTFSSLARDNGYEIMMDGTPNNLFFTGEIKREFKAVGIVRDVRDILASKKRRSKNSDKDYSIIWDSLSINRYYKKLENHRVNNDNILIVRYEDLTENFYDVVKQLQSFLDIEIKRSPETLRFNNSDKINQKGIYRNSGNFKKDLSKSEIWISQLMCRDILTKYNYSKLDISIKDKIKGILFFFSDSLFPFKRLKRINSRMDLRDFKSHLKIQLRKVWIL